MTDMTEQKDEQFIEQVAQFLHDEGGFDEAWTNHTWPEHSEDTGRRDGGFVKIVPADVQAKFRDIARSLVTGFCLSPTPTTAPDRGDRKSVVSGKRDSVRVDLGGRRRLKKIQK